MEGLLQSVRLVVSTPVIVKLDSKKVRHVMQSSIASKFSFANHFCRNMQAGDDRTNSILLQVDFSTKCEAKFVNTHLSANFGLYCNIQETYAQIGPSRTHYIYKRKLIGVA